MTEKRPSLWRKTRYWLAIGFVVIFVGYLFASIGLDYRNNLAVERLTNRYGGHAHYAGSPSILGFSIDELEVSPKLEPAFQRAFDQIDNIGMHGSPSILPSELSPITKIAGSSGVLHVTTFDDTHCDYLSRYKTGALWLESRDISADGFRKISRNENLRFLALTNMEVDRSVAEALVEFPNLKTLFLRLDATITPDAMQALASAHLQGYLQQSEFTFEQARAMSEWKHLTFLKVPGEGITEETLLQLKNSAIPLEQIEVYGPQKVDAKFLETTFGDGGIKIFFLPTWK